MAGGPTHTGRNLLCPSTVKPLCPERKPTAWSTRPLRIWVEVTPGAADGLLVAGGLVDIPYDRLIRQLEVCGAELDRLRELPESDEVTDLIECLEAGYARMCEALAAVPN